MVDNACIHSILALTSWGSANRGTSQNACALFDSGTCFGFSGDFQGGTESRRPKSCKISKKMIFRAALCRIVYLFSAREVQPARTWATLSGALLHSLHITSPVVSVCVFWLAYNLVGSNCSYSSKIPATLCVEHCFQPLSHQRHPSKLGLISSLLIQVSLPCQLCS